LDVLRKHGYAPGLVDRLKAAGEWRADPEFLGVLANDLNTPGAIARLHVLAKGRTPQALIGLGVGLELLGLIDDWSLLDLSPAQGQPMPDSTEGLIEGLLARRAAARADKNWSEADRIRNILNLAGVQVTDVGGQVSWLPGPQFDPAKLEALK
jgi:cysteinyl-tRNA synthetase